MARRLLYWIREFFGENDYARYLGEWRARHVTGEPGSSTGARVGSEHRPLTEGEFFAERCRVRYGGGVQRCC
jgi:uncharacterized short protein YbdD (DUF466 family)